MSARAAGRLPVLAATALSAALLMASLVPAGADTAVPDTSTATPTPSPEPTPTLIARPTVRPTARPTGIPEPSRTVVPAIKPIAPTPEQAIHRRHHHHHKRAASATSTPAPGKVPKRHRRHHKHTPTPTPSATPILNLNAEDSVAPVTCNGPGKPNAASPFLLAPYHGWTSIVSYFDHDLPDFVQDGAITIATGASASVDTTHHAADFPAYWDGSLRQYLYYDGHNGYDYNLWYQPVYAAAAGKVIFARLEYAYAPDHGYGNMIMIQHHGGYVTLYGHLSKFLVHRGEKVNAGQKIAVSGNTGHSSGPHLHFTVFHNCTPTDPYGWTGSGPDPLLSYQGQTSVFLWKRVPDVYNPAPGLEGRLPVGDGTRILLLRLPAASGGTDRFSSQLRATAEAAARILRRRGLTVRVDLLRGGLIVNGAADPDTLYTVPGVASITRQDVEEGARSDVLAALAQAALVTHHRRITVARSTNWSGYIVRLQGRAILVGKGARGKEVDLTLRSRGHASSEHRIQADPKTGAYAVDLGLMSTSQAKKLLGALSGRGSGGADVRVRQVVRQQAPAAPRSSTSSPPWTMLLGILVVVLALGAAVPLAVRRRLGG